MATRVNRSSEKQAPPPESAAGDHKEEGRISLAAFAQIVGECSYIRLSPETQVLVPVGGPSEAVAPALYGEIRNSAGGDRLQAWSALTKNSYTAGRDPEGQLTDCVLLNSVGAEANRLEAGLLAARDDGAEVPDLVIDFTVDDRTRHLGRIGTLATPHRGYDALIRDSLLGGIPFTDTEQGKSLIDARQNNATALLGMPHMALLGAWHTQGPSGGGGAKFGRVLKSEITAYGAAPSDIAASRLDPVAMARSVEIYKRLASSGQTAAKGRADLLTDVDGAPDTRPNIRWETDKRFAEKDGKGNPVLYTPKRAAGKEAGTPALINHGNVLPTAKSGRATIAGAIHTMEMSLIGLRNLHFPGAGAAARSGERDGLARTALAALGLVAMTQRLRGGYHLRSCCNLIARRSPRLEVLGTSLEDTQELDVDAEGALALLGEAVAALRAAGMPWGLDGDPELRPSPQLVEAIHASMGAADDPEAG